jgi:hypothetical protein
VRDALNTVDAAPPGRLAGRGSVAGAVPGLVAPPGRGRDGAPRLLPALDTLPPPSGAARTGDRTGSSRRLAFCSFDRGRRNSSVNGASVCAPRIISTARSYRRGVRAPFTATSRSPSRGLMDRTASLSGPRDDA